MNYEEAKKRLLAAQTLLLEPSSSFEKFSAVKNLIAGVHPQLDEALERCAKDLATVENILGRDFVLLGAENLPENTEEEKRRKKAVLFFFKTWNTLRSEVARVQAEMNSADSTDDALQKSSHWGRIFNFAKGPFGVLTLIAVALVSVSAYTSVQITIHNEGCPTLIPSSSVPNFIPGIKLPADPIPSGGTAEAALPGLPVSVDGTKKGSLIVSMLTFKLTFQLSGVKSATFDGEDLFGKITSVDLSKKKTHELVLKCS